MNKERLESISDKIRKGEPVNILDAISAINYQETLREQRKKSLWKRIKHWWKWQLI